MSDSLKLSDKLWDVDNYWYISTDQRMLCSERHELVKIHRLLIYAKALICVFHKPPHLISRWLYMGHCTHLHTGKTWSSKRLSAQRLQVRDRAKFKLRQYDLSKKGLLGSVLDPSI